MSATAPLLPADALKAMNEAMNLNQADHGDRWRTRSVAHHVGKGMGHAARAMSRRPIDADSGLPHLTLAATRLVLALAVLLAQPNGGRRA